MKINLLERFLQYVQIDTEASEASASYPSSAGQLILGKLLVEELQALGIHDASANEFGIVTGTLPSNVTKPTPTIAWVAHLDTSPESSGKNVNPIVHQNYDGKDLVLPGDPSQVLRIEDCPELAHCVGKTIVTTDGTTLLGGDDKAGIAVIMDAVRILQQNKNLPHGTIRICFTCDEEIGGGTTHLHPNLIKADVAYTLDSEGVGAIDVETFSADLAIVTVEGVNTHPMCAKGKMVNAIRIAGEFLEALPKKMSPEETEDREGFLHPYVLEGKVEKTTFRILLRDFDTENLQRKALLLETVCKDLMKKYPKAKLTVEIQKQYRNMKNGLEKEPRAAGFAIKAMERAGISPKIISIRAGTDGAFLTEMGLPTPNLSAGQHNIHSRLEWVCVEEMEQSRNVLIQLAKIWAEEE